MSAEVFPKNTRFFSAKGFLVAVIGGCLSVVNFSAEPAMEMPDEWFFALDPTTELSESEFRARVGPEKLKVWFASHDAPLADDPQEEAVLRALMAHGFGRKVLIGLSPENARKILVGLEEAQKQVAAEREAEGNWIGTDDWNDMMSEAKRLLDITDESPT